MADQKSQGRLGNLVQGAGPGMQKDLFALVKLAQAVVKLADGHGRIGQASAPKQLRQGTIFQDAGSLPALQVVAKGAHQGFQDFPRTDLAEQVGQTFFRDGADFPAGFSLGFGAEGVNEALILAELGGLFSGDRAGKQTGQGSARKQRHARAFAHGSVEGLQNQLVGLVGQGTLLGLLACAGQAALPVGGYRPGYYAN